MIIDNVNQFFATAVERELIQLRKDGDLPNRHAPHFTDDKVFREWRFCCTDRENDKTTRWFRQNVRGLLQRRAGDVLFATVAFRWFNRIETGEIIHEDLVQGPEAWDVEKVRTKLAGRSPVVTGAYIIKTPNGMNKLDGVLWCIEQVRKDIDHLVTGGFTHSSPEELTIEGFCDAMCMFPYLGPFMAYQIASDLMHTCWLEKATDMYTWAAMGPGSTRGLGWIVENNPDKFKMGSKKDCVVMRGLMQDLIKISEGSSRKWTMQQIQHWLCEYDKYRRAAGGQDQKRRFSV